MNLYGLGAFNPQAQMHEQLLFVFLIVRERCLYIIHVLNGVLRAIN